MTDDKLIALADECGLGPILGGIRDADDMWLDCDVIGGLERFAALVAERTREECARVCDGAPYLGNDACECADLIRSMKAY